MGVRDLDDRWCSKAIMVLQLQVELDMFILAPSVLVFMQGMRKLMNLELMSSSPKWQQHQNAMHATVKTAMSNASMRLR